MSHFVELQFIKSSQSSTVTALVLYPVTANQNIIPAVTHASH